ncbi:ATP-binding protein [Pelovirga terrestris]|uniref:histidine kinase n=1 Tax=Pelovirga terrestris TaxID=2771352 RepID=A0A8J6UPZ6_9BACT|nr:ATP-binding protein [Pelovirga terrestris]MBD1401234.1 response regulator [Pelovirga terrestris]
MSEKPSIRILIVEDEPAHVEMICLHLERAGNMDIQLAANMENCLEAIASSPPDIILVDLHLPDGGAIELLSKIDGKVPIITMTSRGSEEQAVEVLKSGAQDYLTKSPETFAAMPRTVERAVREWQLQRDIEQANEKVRAQKSLVEALLQNTATPIFVVDPQHRVLIWNKACTELTGVKAADVVGTDRHWSAFYAQKRPCLIDVVLEGSPPELLTEWYPHHSRSESLEESLQAEGWRTGRAGEPVYLTFNAALVRDTDGTVIAAIETLQDITARKKMEDDLVASREALTRQHEKLDHLFKQVEQAKQEWEATLDCMSDIIILVDKKGMVMRSNRALDELVNAPFTDIHGHPWHELLAIPQGAEDLAQVRSQEFFHQPTRRWFLLSMYPVTELESKGTAGQVITLNDRTEIKQMTAKLEQANRELKQAHVQQLQSEKMASIGQLAAGVAHEINNPIGFVTSNLGSLEKYVAKLNEFITFLSSDFMDNLDPEQREQVALRRKQLKIDLVLEDINDLLAESRDGVERVGKIVRDLKGFSRVDEAEHKMAHVEECLESAINIAWNEIKYKATLTRDFAELPAILCYPGQLNQVFVNMLVNAAQAIDDQGTIDVATWQEGDHVLIRITDSGCGISEENCKRIFDPFFTTKEVGKGTGLGLSITYDIIKKHQGEIHVTSREGEGTRFTIKLPAQRVEST